MFFLLRPNGEKKQICRSVASSHWVCLVPISIERRPVFVAPLRSWDERERYWWSWLSIDYCRRRCVVLSYPVNAIETTAGATEKVGSEDDEATGFHWNVPFISSLLPYQRIEVHNERVKLYLAERDCVRLSAMHHMPFDRANHHEPLNGRPAESWKII
jgi:hypothetical protein